MTFASIVRWNVLKTVAKIWRDVTWTDTCWTTVECVTSDANSATNRWRRRRKWSTCSSATSFLCRVPTDVRGSTLRESRLVGQSECKHSISSQFLNFKLFSSFKLTWISTANARKCRALSPKLAALLRWARTLKKKQDNHEQVVISVTVFTF